MRTIVILIACLFPSITLADTSSTTMTTPISPFITLQPMNGASATVLFEATMVARRDEAKQCGKEKVVSQKYMARHARAIIKACYYFWGEDSTAWYRMGMLLYSESNGHKGKNSPNTEETYGFYCTSVVEVRETCAEFTHIPCPKGRRDIIERLQEDPEWAALVAAGTLYRCDRIQGADRTKGILMYKCGASKLRQLLKTNLIEELSIYRFISAELRRLYCIRDRLIQGGIWIPCQCYQT